LDPEGDIYVADTGNHCIQKLSPTGEPLAQWGQEGRAPGQFGLPSGTGPGQFRLPQGVAVDGEGSIYVADTDNHRIQKLSSDGVPLAQWGLPDAIPGRISWPRNIAVDASGDLYVVD